MTHNFTVAPKSIKYLKTSRGVAFTANLLLKGKKIGIIENGGTGGATISRVDSSEGRKQLALDISSSVHNIEEFFLDNLMDVAEGVA